VTIGLLCLQTFALKFSGKVWEVSCDSIPRDFVLTLDGGDMMMHDGHVGARGIILDPLDPVCFSCPSDAVVQSKHHDASPLP